MKVIEVLFSVGSGVVEDVDLDIHYPVGHYVHTVSKENVALRDGDIFQTLVWGGGSNLDRIKVEFDAIHYYDIGAINNPMGFAEVRTTDVYLPEDQACSPCDCPFGCSHNSQGWVGGPINSRTGNYHYSQQDVAIPALGQDLYFERSYNVQTRDTYTTFLGYGWTHNYATRAVLPSMAGGESGRVIIQGCRGSRFRFDDNGDGTFDPWPGVWATLTRTQSTPYTYTLTGVDQSTYLFDATGQLVEIRGPEGHALRLSYTNDRLTRVADATDARYLTFTYNAAGRLVAVSDPLSRTIGYGYDAEGDDLAVVTDTRGITWTYTYTGAHLLRDVRDPLNHLVERTEYDAQGRAIRQWTGGATTPMEIAYGSTVVITDALGHVTEDGYSIGGVLVAEADAAGSSTRSFDANLNWTATTDANDHTIYYDFNTMGLPEVITDALGSDTRITYDAAHHPTRIVDTQGNVTTYGYEGNRLITTTDALSGTVINTYNDDGLLIRSVARGLTTTYEYDAWGQRTVVTDATGLVTRYGYDAVGRLITTTAATGLVTVNAYDDGDNLIRVTRNTTTAGGQNYLGIYNQVTAYGYDAAGRRVLVTDTLGTVTRSAYDAAGRLVRTWRNYLPGQPQNYQAIYNLVTSYGYDDLGRQVLVTDTLGSVTYTAYDALDRVWRTWRNYLPGQPQNYQDAYNLVTTYGYDAVGNQTHVTDTLGSVTHTAYDALNRPVTVTTNYVDGVFNAAYPDEDLIQITVYDQAGRVARTVDPAGRVTHHAYDGAGRPVTVTTNYVDGVFDPARPDEDVQQVTVYDPATGRVTARLRVAGTTLPTTYAYDVLGRLVTTTNALSGTTVTQYDVLGRRSATIDAEGHVTRYGYDAAGRLVTTTNALSGTMITTYDALGRRVAQTNPLGHTTVYTYTGAGRLVAQADPLGGVTQYGYDALGRRTVITDADGVATTSVYNALGQLAATVDDLGNTTSYGYDALGRRTVMTDANGVATTYTYDDQGRLTGVVENHQAGVSADRATNVATTYTYDASGNMTAVADGLGHTTVYTYDLANRRVAEADALGHVTRYTYDGHGRRTGVTYPDAAGAFTVTTAYNALGWATEVVYPGVGAASGFTVTYGYTALGHRDAVTDALGVMAYDYDALYRPLDVAAPTGAVSYTYDVAGRRTHMVYPTGETVTYTHDAAGRLRTVTDWDGGVTVYTYTTAGRLSALARPNGVRSAYHYDDAGRLVEIEHRDGSERLLACYTYTLDGVGNRTGVTETVLTPVDTQSAVLGTEAAGPAMSRLPGPARLLAVRASDEVGEGVAEPARLSFLPQGYPPSLVAEPLHIGDAAREDPPPQDGPLPPEVPPAWLDRITEDVARSEYRVTWQERTPLADVAGAYQAPNRAQNLRAYFTPDSLRVVPRTTEAPAWALRLRVTGYGDRATMLSVAGADPQVAGNGVKYERGDLVEWYVNHDAGLEQGFTLSRPPANAADGWVTIDMVYSGDLQASLVEDGAAVEFAADGVRVLRYGEVHAYDAANTPLPAHLALEEDHIRLLVDTSGAAYPVVVDPLFTAPDWAVAGGQASAAFGTAVSTAGDVNGDGYSDVVVGAPGFDGGETDEGKVFVYHGSVDGLGTTAAWTAEGNQAGARLGESVSLAGDVNGDGYGDVAVGAPDYDNGESDEGQVFVYHGGMSGLSATADWTADGDQAAAHFGSSVRLAGDVNGDGYSDLAVGAPDYDDGQSDEGQVFVYHGGTSGLSAAADWTAAGNQASAHFGAAVGAAGDVTGDGYADLVVGAPDYDNGETDEGRAFVYHGSGTGLGASAAWTVESNQASAHLGAAVGAAGDLTGDGYADVVVGIPDYDGGQADEGRVCVYAGGGSGLSTTCTWEAESDQAGAHLGGHVGPAGDVDGDGWTDVIAGAAGYDGSGTDAGRAYVFRGAALDVSAAPGWSVESNQASAHLGYFVATAGDLNGDGYADVVVGAPDYDNGQSDEGRAYVYLGAATGLNTTPHRTLEINQAGAHFGVAVGTAGDVNGDGYSDLIVGADGYDNGQSDEGGAWVYYGASGGLSTTAAWAVESDQAGSEFGYWVSTAGDVNGDGYADVIVGAYKYDNGETDEGAAFVYHGSSGGLSTTPDWTADGDQANAQYGVAVNPAGDVNGDGYGDVVVGAYVYDAMYTDEGRAELFYGGAGGLSTTSDWAVNGGQAYAYLGDAVATAGDVNGDGYSDIVVGSYGYDNGQTDEGRAYVYYGSASGPATTPDWVNEIDAGGAHYGTAVATAGDVNGDGYADVIVGAKFESHGQLSEGRSYLYLGGAGGLATTSSWIGEIDKALASFGGSVGTAGDVNGDGYAEVIVGAGWYTNGWFQNSEGYAALYYGNGGVGRDLRLRQRRLDDTAPVAPGGRSDGTGVQVALTGRAPLGRADAKLQWQAAPVGTPFTATTGVVAGMSASWRPLWASGTVVTQTLTGLQSDTAYHWRVRWRYAPDNVLGQPAGRWLHVPWHGELETDVRTAVVTETVISGLAASNDSPKALGEATTLTATVSAGTNVGYAWAFGDGDTGSGAVVTHTYAGTGNYTAVVTASNSVSTLTTTTPVTITTPAPVTVTRTITYTYDPLHRLTGATYSTGEAYAYAYDAVGNRTAMTVTQNVTTTTVTTYTYDAANRLTSIQQPASSIAYAWDARGNLTHDGVFTYTYNAAGRMVRAESLTATLRYTYTVDGLRVVQDVDGAVTTFAWDWATGVPEMLSDGSARYLVGHDTLGWEDGAGWTYAVPDALGSVRQAVDAAGAVVAAREWTPYGVAVGGTGQAGLGYTGEWYDASVGLQYLRARWYDVQSGRFTQQDVWEGDFNRPLTSNPYLYALSSPVSYVDPSGYGPEWWERMLQDETWRSVLLDSSSRHNITSLPDQEFAALMAAIVRIESGAIHHRPASYPTVALVKSLEILYNRTFYPRLFDRRGEDFVLGYQTEGISNISVTTISNLRRGLVPDVAGNLQQTDIEIYDYSAEPLPAVFPFPGLKVGQQIAILSELTSLTYLADPILALPWSCLNVNWLLQSVRQDQNIEYLAANLEAGAVRAGWESVQPTAEVLSWWNFRGIVKMTDEAKLQQEIAETQDLKHQAWLREVLQTQADARAYWDLASSIVQEAAGLLSR